MFLCPYIRKFTKFSFSFSKIPMYEFKERVLGKVEITIVKSSLEMMST